MLLQFGLRGPGKRRLLSRWPVVLVFLFCALGAKAQPVRSEPASITAESRWQALDHSGLSVDTADREAVRTFFNAIFTADAHHRSSWDGSLLDCLPGTTSAEFQEAVLTRINFYRALAGVPAEVEFDPVFSLRAQTAALMTSTSGSVDHSPAPDVPCYTSEGAEAAGNSNLALGTSGIDSIEAYMLDAGPNYRVGHRRWLLYPQTRRMGNGDIDPPDGSTVRRANANWIFDENFGGARPATRSGFVAWPPPGFVPHQLVYPRWSFSYPRAQFDNASVTVSRAGEALPVVIEQLAIGYGENAIVFVPGDYAPEARLHYPAPEKDETYTVTVSNLVTSAGITNFTYQVTVFDPAKVGPGEAPAALIGSAQLEAGRTNRFRLAPVPNASSYELRYGALAPMTPIAGESSVRAFTSGLYALVQTNIYASSNSAFHLAHTSPARPQWFILTNIIVPTLRTELLFASRLGGASTGQVARVQVSVDEGSSWRDMYSQAGDGQHGELEFQSKAVSLAEFANRAVLIRFQYGFSFGEFNYVPGTDDQIGWYIDDIQFTFAQELRHPEIVSSPGPEFRFVPREGEAYYLDARARLFGRFAGEWTLGKTAQTVEAWPLIPEVRITSVRPAAESIEIEFEPIDARPSATFYLESSRGLSGPWAPHFEAVLQNSAAAGRRLFQIGRTSEDQFFRVTVD